MRIKFLREKNNMAQRELAEKMGVNQVTVSDWETGKSAPTAAKIPTLAKALGCEINDLFDAEK